jgi:hypothetical protein
MDEERRQQLNARRVALRERLDREEQRAALWGVDETLAAAGTPFRLLYRDAVPRPDWIGDLVPARLFHLDWERVPEAVADTVFEDERPAWARAMLAPLAPDTTLWVVRGNGLAPIIELSHAAFDRHAELLTDMDDEMWLSGAPHWLIEFRGLQTHATGLALPPLNDWRRASG